MSPAPWHTDAVPRTTLSQKQFRSLSIGRRQAELTARSALEMAEAELEALNRAHHEHMLEMVNTAQTLENKRHARLGAAKSQAEAAQLEKRFTRERRHEETRIQQIQEEHSHLCQVRGRSLSRPFPLFSRPAPPFPKYV